MHMLKLPMLMLLHFAMRVEGKIFIFLNGSNVVRLKVHIDLIIIKPHFTIKKIDGLQSLMMDLAITTGL